MYTDLQVVVRNQDLTHRCASREAGHLLDVVVLRVQTLELVQIAHLDGQLFDVVLGYVELLQVYIFFFSLVLLIQYLFIG